MFGQFGMVSKLTDNIVLCSFNHEGSYQLMQNQWMLYIQIVLSTVTIIHDHDHLRITQCKYNN